MPTLLVTSTHHADDQMCKSTMDFLFKKKKSLALILVIGINRYIGEGVISIFAKCAFYFLFQLPRVRGVDHIHILNLYLKKYKFYENEVKSEASRIPREKLMLVFT